MLPQIADFGLSRELKSQHGMQTATYGTVSLPYPCVPFHWFTKLVLHLGTCMFVAARQAETRNTNRFCAGHAHAARANARADAHHSLRRLQVNRPALRAKAGPLHTVFAAVTSLIHGVQIRFEILCLIVASSHPLQL